MESQQEEGAHQGEPGAETGVGAEGLDALPTLKPTTSVMQQPINMHVSVHATESGSYMGQNQVRLDGCYEPTNMHVNATLHVMLLLPNAFTHPGNPTCQRP